MEELMVLIEKSNEALITARLAGDIAEANRLSIVIGKAECELKLITG